MSLNENLNEKVRELITTMKNIFVLRKDIFQNGVFTTINTKENGTTARLWNESDGGGAQIIDGNTNVKAFTGVNEGSDGSNIYAQIYAINKDNSTGARINVNEDGAYYTSGKNTYRFTVDDEIATKGDLNNVAGAGEITIEKQETADDGFATTYVIKQGGIPINPKINIEKDRMIKNAGVKTVSGAPNTEENLAGLKSGDSYISLIVNTTDNDSATELIIPINSLFDLQKADEETLTLDGDTYSIKEGGVTATQIADETITISQIAPSLSETWLTNEDVDTEIEAFIDGVTAGLKE